MLASLSFNPFNSSAFEIVIMLSSLSFNPSAFETVIMLAFLSFNLTRNRSKSDTEIRSVAPPVNVLLVVVVVLELEV